MKAAIKTSHLEEWPILQSLPLTWNKSCLQVISYSCNLLYVKQSNHSHLKVMNGVRESKNLEIRERAKHLTPTLNYRWRAAYQLFSLIRVLFSLYSSSKNQPLFPICVLSPLRQPDQLKF